MIEQLYHFYKTKKVLITGHSGFKGTWLTLWLKLMGADVCGFSMEPPGPINFHDLSKIDGMISSVHGDIRELQSVQKVVAGFKPDIIIHMAAQSLVKKSYKNPVETYSTNIMGTVNLLESVRLEKGVKVVINVTSDKCYENQNWLRGYRESDPMGGFDPYSSSKGCSELITSAYMRSFFDPDSACSGCNTAIASARAGNVIGGGDFAEDRLIPDMVRAFLKDESVYIRNPKAIRPWQHVLEPLYGYLLLALKLFENSAGFSGPWNFGPQSGGVKDVGSVADKFVTLWGAGASWTHDHKSHPHEASLLELDSSKADTLLGWRTRLNVDDALMLTADWYKCLRDKPEELMALSENQIKGYEKILNEIY